jgi:transcriptional regulator with XRE-family HTH domain
MNFIKRFKEERLRLGLNQVEIAKIFNVSKQTVSNWENGKRSPDTETLIKLADMFGVSVDYLICRTDKRNESDLDCSDNFSSDDEEKDVEKIIDELMNQSGLMLCGEPLSEVDVLLLRNSIRSTIELAKIMKKNKL